MPEIAKEVLTQRLERSGAISRLQEDVEALCGVRLVWRAEPAAGEAFSLPLLVASITVGHVRVTETLPAPKQRALERVLGLALEALAHQLAHPLGHRQEALPWTVQRAVQHIREHFSDPLSLGEVANAVGLSRERLSRLFHESLGVTFSEYLNRARLDHCRNLLHHSSLSVADIAFASGFQSLSQFNRRFKSAENISPREYRRRAGLV